LAEVEILIRKAESKLNTAKILFEDEIYEDAISRAYYSMFYATKALLRTRNIVTKTHKGLISKFGLEFVKNGEIGEEYASMISTVEERRERADYDAYYEPSGDEAEKIIEDAEGFLELIKEAKADRNAVERAHNRAGKYLKLRGTTLETERKLVDNCFLLEQVFHGIMKKADCRAITINGCMGTIIPIAETTACLTLSLLNDAGYLAFCESDFVVIPSGVLLANISGKPVFLNDPTYPHDGLITLAHCTAPRRMDGKKREPARILTHFESDYGAAPKVEMHKGQLITSIVPDFAIKRWVGLAGEIVDAPFMDVCRSQIDVRFSCDSQKLAERMPGFHWMVCYGDYLREVGYVCKKVGIELENLTA